MDRDGEYYTQGSDSSGFEVKSNIIFGCIQTSGGGGRVKLYVHIDCLLSTPTIPTEKETVGLISEETEKRGRVYKYLWPVVLCSGPGNTPI